MHKFNWIVLVAFVLTLGGCSASSGEQRTSKSALSASKQRTTQKKKKRRRRKKGTVVVKKPAAQSAKIRTAALRADKGVVFGPGKILVDGSGMKVDLIAYKHGAGLDLKAGRQGTSYLPLHRFGSKTFGNIENVPCTPPADSEKNAMIALPKKGQAFTVRASQSGGVWRVRIKNVSGGEVKVQYQKCK